MNKELVRIIENPVIFQNLCKMRDKNTDSQGVRLATRKITRVLLYEAAKNLPLVDKKIETPIKTTTFKTIKEDINIIISPILRAGLIFTDEAIDILPQACIRHIGMYRDEKTLKPVWYYNKVPMEAPNPENFYIYITDTMLATGVSVLWQLQKVLKISKENFQKLKLSQQQLMKVSTKKVTLYQAWAMQATEFSILNISTKI